MNATFKLFAGLLLLATTFLAPSAIVGNVLAGITSLALLGTIATSAPAVMSMEPSGIAQVIAMQDPLRAYELDRGTGVVVFKTIDGKLTSRFYRASA